jgi:sugar phosphate isomerase/epimerase/lysophospholipase L1-like esterase
MSTKYLISLLFILISITLISQDPHRFQEEIDNFKSADELVNYHDVVLFTGSSSVRFWKTLGEDFPSHNVLNRGFGGSQFSDLIYFADQLILQYNPKKIFIYEGDNDLSEGKSVENIMADASQLVYKIRRTLPEADIHFIAPKPSVARWNLKESYIKLNSEIKAWCEMDAKLHFVDVWTPMCDEDGEVMPDLFIIDKLHMNEKGYKIWKDVVSPFLEKEIQEGSPIYSGPIGVQAYSFRNYFPKDVVGTLDKIQSMGISQIEGDGGRIPNDEFRKLCSARGITIPSTGCQFGELTSNPMAIVEKAKVLGASHVMCPWIPHKVRGNFSLDDAKRAVEAFNSGGKVLKEHGITFCYHPHGYEFQPYGEGTLMDYIIQNTDPEYVSFEMDVFWTHFGGGDPVALLKKYPNRWKMLHLKDMKKGIKKDLTGGTDVEHNVPLGTGEIDMEGIMKTAKEIGIDFYFIEDESSSVMGQVPQSVKWIRGIKY